jgi:hypothetical protein
MHDAYKHITLTFVLWGDSQSLEYILENTQLKKTFKFSLNRRKCLIVLTGDLLHYIYDIVKILRSGNADDDTVMAYTSIYRYINKAGLKEIWESFKIVDVDADHIRIL